MKSIIILLLSIGTWQPVSASPQSDREQKLTDSLQLLLDSALHTMRDLSVFSQSVDWKKITDSAMVLCRNAQSETDLYPAIRYAFNQLNDHHGWLILGGKKYVHPLQKMDTSRLSSNIKLAASKGPRIYAGRQGTDYAYVSVPFFNSQDTTSMKNFARQLQDSLCTTVNPGTRGIIIDLRLNAGGNSYPMFAGLANVLGDGIYSYDKDGKGNTTGVNQLTDGGVRLHDSTLLRVSNGCGKLTEFPVAIITGPITASSGEILAIAFRGRRNTVLIGDTTAGYVTLNDGRYLPGKANGIVLATSFVSDRDGQVYRTNVIPDIIPEGEENFFDHSKDKNILAAVRYFRNLINSFTTL